MSSANCRPVSPGFSLLTHWDRVTHVCVSKRRQAVKWTRVNKLQWIRYRNLYIFIQENAFENVVWKMAAILSRPQFVNTLRPRQNGRHFADGIFNCIFLNKNVWIPSKTSLTFVHRGPINNMPALAQITVWRRPGDKPLSESMMVSLTTHICVTRPQWVKRALYFSGHPIKSQRLRAYGNNYTESFLCIFFMKSYL